MIEKRYQVIDNDFSVHIEDTKYIEDKHEHNIYDVYDMCRKLNELNNCVQELLWKIGDLGYNNKPCKSCECFITDIHYCWMWDMEVKPNEIVVKCDERQERKNENGN